MLEIIPLLLIPFILGFTAGVVFILLKLKGGAKWLRAIEADLEQAQERAESLERDLKCKQDEINHYKENVTGHFTKTAELFNTLTNDYRSIYEHMAKGAQELCSGSVVQLSSHMPNERLLTQTENETQNSIEGHIVQPGGKMPGPSTLTENAAQNPSAIVQSYSEMTDKSPSISTESGPQKPNASRIGPQPSGKASPQSAPTQTEVKSTVRKVNPAGR